MRRTRKTEKPEGRKLPPAFTFGFHRMRGKRACFPYKDQKKMMIKLQEY